MDTKEQSIEFEAAHDSSSYGYRGRDSLNLFDPYEKSDWKWRATLFPAIFGKEKLFNHRGHKIRISFISTGVVLPWATEPTSLRYSPERLRETLTNDLQGGKFQARHDGQSQINIIGEHGVYARLHKDFFDLKDGEVLSTFEFQIIPN